MPHGFHNGQHVKLLLRPLPPPENLERPPWNAAFIKSKTLQPVKQEFTDRPIRDVKLETAIFRSGGTPDLANSFALKESDDLREKIERDIDVLSVPQREWYHVDTVSERSVYTKSAAPEGALSLARNSKGFTTNYGYPTGGRSRNSSGSHRW
eukprot:CAMPEP_0114360288 /NCGR_PEP_ID=MMETSP0101-20121206/23725_1 /TAXON_ID=38822 ORGANISM="Pteridomonas danica, Strain PT" /NCGR_SAMPLE_ID=MMETSP0101 /ASSEMBLY_ACC=CAM_ASM_000211 /LENGTH=151 /DNA_ID=CAMNT_0001504397 /DNA_START=218 /DNA_END=673 /DNA_ORIENTATION=-